MRRAGATSVTADVPGAWPRYSNESALAAYDRAADAVWSDAELLHLIRQQRQEASECYHKALRRAPTSIQTPAARITEPQQAPVAEVPVTLSEVLAS